MPDLTVSGMGHNPLLTCNFIYFSNSAFWKWSFSIFHSCSCKFKAERKKSGETIRNLAIISCKYYTLSNLWKIQIFCKKSVNAYLFVWSLPHSLAWRFNCNTIQRWVTNTFGSWNLVFMAMHDNGLLWNLIWGALCSATLVQLLLSVWNFSLNCICDLKHYLHLFPFKCQLLLTVLTFLSTYFEISFFFSQPCLVFFSFFPFLFFFLLFLCSFLFFLFLSSILSSVLLSITFRTDSSADTNSCPFEQLQHCYAINTMLMSVNHFPFR